MVRQDECRGATYDEGEPISRDPHAGSWSPFFRTEIFRPVGVEGNILTGTEKGDEQGEEGGERGIVMGVELSHGYNQHDKTYLGEQDPSSPPAKEGRSEPVHEG